MEVCSLVFETINNVKIVGTTKDIPSFINCEPLKLPPNIKDIPYHDIITTRGYNFYNDPNYPLRSEYFLGIIDYHQPKCIFLHFIYECYYEKNISCALKKRGYYICEKKLKTSEITDIPYNQECFYVICIKSKKVFDKFSLEFPKSKNKKISEFLEEPISKICYTNSDYYKFRSSKSEYNEFLTKNIIKKDTIYEYRMKRVHDRNICGTKCIEELHGFPQYYNFTKSPLLILDNKCIRSLTPQECLNLEGFPSTYKSKSTNSDVSYPVIKLIADRIIPLLLEDII